MSGPTAPAAITQPCSPPSLKHSSFLKATSGTAKRTPHTARAVSVEIGCLGYSKTLETPTRSPATDLGWVNVPLTGPSAVAGTRHDSSGPLPRPHRNGSHEHGCPGGTRTAPPRPPLPPMPQPPPAPTTPTGITAPGSWPPPAHNPHPSHAPPPPVPPGRGPSPLSLPPRPGPPTPPSSPTPSPPNLLEPGRTNPSRAGEAARSPPPPPVPGPARRGPAGPTSAPSAAATAAAPTAARLLPGAGGDTPPSSRLPRADWCAGQGRAGGEASGVASRPMGGRAGGDAQSRDTTLSPPPPRAGV